jgi:putative mRNA 3-end processing factor
MTQLGNLLALTDDGLYCPAGDFYVDPWRRQKTAVVTHGHSDHARWGSSLYVTHRDNEPIMRSRLGQDIVVNAVEYNEPTKIGSAWVSFHPAGHVLGSSQIRIELDGRVAVISGDYKRQTDSTCVPFEVVPCDLFVTETTFGLPSFRWPRPEVAFHEINRWWRDNQSKGQTSLLMAYALGKSQRLLSGIDSSIGPIVLHGAIKGPTEIYKRAGIKLPEYFTVHDKPADIPWSQCLVIAVPSAYRTPWANRLGDVAGAMASGWMAVRGVRRRRSVDQGFVISDHVDWHDMLATIHATGAKRIWTTHGFSNIVARYLNEEGFEAESLATQFQGEVEEEPENEESEVENRE